MKRWQKWTGITLGGIFGTILVALLVIYAVSELRIRKRYDIQPPTIAISTDPATIAEGHRLAVTRGCTDCHGPNLEGRVFIDAMPMATLIASNLTRGEGGVGNAYGEVDLIRAIRHGVKPDGRPTLFMPAHEFNPMSDTDLAKLIAYIRSLPAVDNVLPDNTVGPLGRALFLAGQVPLLPAEMIDHDAPRAPAVPAGPTAEYGKYLAVGCTGCHGEGYSGGAIPGTPPGFPIAANITPDDVSGIGRWTEADFTRALREGKRPNGDTINSIMPWRGTSQMTDDEIRALWLFLRTTTPRPHGNR